jgi:hypothetical protein
LVAPHCPKKLIGALDGLVRLPTKDIKKKERKKERKKEGRKEK